jgi:Na+-driven multidrug efflux pump
MEHVIPIVMVVAVLAAWNLFLYNRSSGRAWSPLWMAFTTTSVALVFFAAGATGYRLDKHDRFKARTPWAGGIIWWEIAVAVAIGLLAVYFWRKGLEDVRAR